jgi:hypothetical protein
MENPHKSIQNMIITSKYVRICINKLQSLCMNFACITDPLPSSGFTTHVEPHVLVGHLLVNEGVVASLMAQVSA